MKQSPWYSAQRKHVMFTLWYDTQGDYWYTLVG